MSTHDLETGGQGYTDTPQIPTQAANMPRNCNFPLQYEARVNENMRNFSQFEGQVGTGAEKVEDSKKKKKRDWMRFAIFAVPVGLLIVGVVTGFALSVHWSKATGDSPSPTANGDTLHTTTASGSSSTAVPTTAEHSTATVTSLSISTEVSQSTVTKTTTASASIPESIAAAASSFYGAWGTRIASEASKAAALATPSLTPSTTSSIQETSHAAQTSKTTTTPLPPTFTTSTASTLVSTTERASGHGRMGVSRRPSKTSTGAGARANRVQFCGAPGTPCLGGRDGGEWDGENGY